MMAMTMATKTKELTALAVSRLKTPGLHFVGGVAGLALQVVESGARSWKLRAVVGSKRRDIGLGGFPDVPLADAKERARIARDKIRNGIDPIAEKQAIKSALIAAEIGNLTFDKAAERLIKSKEAEWSNTKHVAQWRSTVETYASPKIGNILARDVTVSHITLILNQQDLWTNKTETASRLRGRIETILDFAAVTEKRNDGFSNPARWRGNLEHVLPKPSKVAKVKHHPALPYSELGDFMSELKKHEGIGPKALEMSILTATRSIEVRGARWSEFDMKKAIWTIPAERMKMKIEHRVPLSGAALSLLKEIKLTHHADSDLVFPGRKKGSNISDMTMSAVLKRMDLKVVPHGFRSTFRDWAAECTNYPRDVAEMALAHAIGDKVEAAYRRGDLFEKRTRMMADWGAFCAAPSITAGNVVPLHSVA
jgi:integrase